MGYNIWQYGYDAVDTFSTDGDWMKRSMLTNNFVCICGIVVTLVTIYGNMVMMLLTHFLQIWIV